MSQGRPGDHPISDVLFHDAEYFTPEIRALFKEVYTLSFKHFNVFKDINLTDDSETIHKKLTLLKQQLNES
tara:strand:+ start:73269 stop:73481 length:213 start_codon:yes stop_codon:yes gene_type:complete